MRVLHVIPSVAHRYGGPSIAIGPMCRALMRSGIDVTIATTDADGPGRLDVPLGVATRWDGVPAMIFHRDISESFKYSYGLSRWLRSHVHTFDLVHIHAVLSHASLSAAAACRRSAIPYIVRPLGTIAAWSLARNRGRKRLLMKLAAERMLRGAAAIHCTSDEERLDAEKTLGLTQGVTIPLGVDARAFAPDAAALAGREQDRYVLALTRLDPKKNLELLITSFAATRRLATDSWRLVIAGAGDDAYLQSLRALVREHTAGESVTFAGWVDGEDKRRLLQQASLFVLPSRHENFGVSVLEAAAAGVPPIVSEAVQIGETVQRTGAGWIVGLEPESLRTVLSAAMRNDDERRRRGEAAREMALSFDWPLVGERLVSLYQRVLSTSTRVSHHVAAEES